MSGSVVYAVNTGWVTSAVYTNRGETWAADDPVVAENPNAFTADPEVAGLVRRSGAVVEQATAEPGERRTLPRRPRGAGSSE
jgi:hypothetical protein